MSILMSNEILDAINNELSIATKSVQIITAYCKQNSFQHLLNLIDKTIVDKKLLVRFRMDDICKGSSDFEVITDAIADGWKVFLRFDLHAKTYIVDSKRGIVGSANATNSGLGLSKRPNLEMATLVDMDFKDIQKINKLYLQAVPVDQDLLEKMKMELAAVAHETQLTSCSWSETITKRFEPTIETLFSHELPDTDKINGYLSFLDGEFNGDKTVVKNAFRWSIAYLWLQQTVKKHDGEMYFGELTAELHNALVTEPKPYRKDVKILLANLLSFVEQLDMDELTIDRPNHSQRIRLVR